MTTLHYIFIFSAAIAIYFLTIRIIKVIVEISNKNGLLEKINERSSHVHPTPSRGGLVFILPILLILFMKDQDVIVAAIIGMSMLILGFIDDTFDMSPKSKLTFEISAATILFLFNFSFLNNFVFFESDYLNYSAAFIFTVLFFVGGVNAFNLIDGIDGLAGSIGVVNMVFFCIAFYAYGEYEFASFSFLVLISLLAFLKMNWQPAIIFMGDTGSLMIGALIIIFIFKIYTMENTALFCSSLSVIALPIIDTARLLVKRILGGKSPFKADKNHFHHLLLRFNHNHSQAAKILLKIHLTIIITSTALIQILELSLISTTIFILLISIISYVIIDVKAINKLNSSRRSNLKNVHEIILKNKLIKP